MWTTFFTTSRPLAKLYSGSWGSALCASIFRDPKKVWAKSNPSSHLLLCTALRSISLFETKMNKKYACTNFDFRKFRKTIYTFQLFAALFNAFVLSACTLFAHSNPWCNFRPLVSKSNNALCACASMCDNKRFFVSVELRGVKISPDPIPYQNSEKRDWGLANDP